MKMGFDSTVLPREALLITCGSHEDRCLGLIHHLDDWKPDKSIVLSYEDEATNSGSHLTTLIEQLSDLSPVCQIPLSHIGFSVGQPHSDLHNELDESNDCAIVLDISVLSQGCLLSLLRRLDDHGVWDRLWIVYTEPRRYEIERNIPLSFGVSSVSSLPGYIPHSNPSQPLHVVIFLGYEGDRAFATYDILQPVKTTVIVPHPPFRPEWEGRTEAYNRNLLAALDDEVSIERADSLDPSSSTATLTSILGTPSSRPELSRALCPLGTKPQTLGAYNYLRECVDPPAVVYSRVLRHSRYYSSGIGQHLANSMSPIGTLSSRLDRYPGKMVSHLAKKLVRRYATDADHLVDPFCGSGAILYAGLCNNVRVTGVDINPFAVLLSKVKLQGFCTNKASQLCDNILKQSYTSDQYSLEWPNASYWFTPANFTEIRTDSLCSTPLESLRRPGRLRSSFGTSTLG